MVHLNPPSSESDTADLVDQAIEQAMFACCCVSHSALRNVSPGAVTFGRDMLLDFPFFADLLSLSEYRQRQIDHRLLRTNQRRRPHDWKVGELVMVAESLSPGDKLKPAFTGPFPIIQTYTNGNVTVRHNNFVEDRVNVRRLKPFKGSTNTLVSTSATRANTTS